MTEHCIRCNKPTPSHPDTPITLHRYYVEGSDQLCEQCFSQLYPAATASVSTSHAPSATTITSIPRDKQTTENKEIQESAGEENIKTITLPTPTTPTQADKEKYKEVINKETLTGEEREELARLYEKYTD